MSPCALCWNNARVPPICDACHSDMGLARGQVRAREASGWTLEDAILTPSIKGQKRVMTVQRDYSAYQRDWHGRYAQPVRAAAAMAKEER